MPELPEVETLVGDIRKELVGKTIAKVEVLYRPIVKTPIKNFHKDLVRAVITGARRRAKFILIELDRPLTLLVHLKMTGHLFLAPQRHKTPHTHLILYFSDGTFLHYIDPRKFGRWWLYPRESIERTRELKRAGSEPLSSLFTWDKFNEMLSPKKGKIKPLLMDQTFIAGIGNIYADEILFRAHLHPLRPVESLGPKERKELYHAIREKLEEGIRFRGCSVETFTDIHGKPGTMQEHLLVYGRKGAPCPRCGLALKTLKLAGRTSCFCGHCQKAE